MEIPLKLVSYTGGDDKDDRSFGFIVSDTQSQQLVCHLFKSHDKTVCLTLHQLMIRTVIIFPITYRRIR